MTQIFKAGKNVPMVVKIFMECFPNLREFILSKEELTVSSTGDVSTIDSPNIVRPVVENKIYEYYLEGMLTIHNEKVMLSKRKILPKGIQRIVVMLAEQIHLIQRTNILKEYVHRINGVYRLKDLFELLVQRKISFQTLSVIMEAIFYFNLAVIVSIMNTDLSIVLQTQVPVSMKIFRDFHESRVEMVREFVQVSRKSYSSLIWYIFGARL